MRYRNKKNERSSGWYYVSALLLAGVAQISSNVELFFLFFLFFFASTALLSIACEEDHPFHIMIVGSHYSFCIVPIILAYSSGIHIAAYPLVLCLYGTALAMYLTRGYKLKSFDHGEKTIIPLTLFFIFSISLYLTLYLTAGGSFIPTVVLYLVIFAITIQSREAPIAILLLLVYSSYVVFYATFYWDGYGRLIIFGCLLMAAMIVQWRFLPGRIWKWALFWIMGFGSLVGTWFRFGGSSLEAVLESATRDSTFSPILLLSRIYASAPETFANIPGWLDQIILFFLIGVPRIWWSEKPLGFGYLYTVENLEKYLVDAGHSVAATFVGENIYYLGIDGAILGVSFNIFILSYLYRVLCQKSIMNGYASIAVAIWIPTFYWGGIAAFSARFTTSILFFWMLYIIYSIYSRIQKRKKRAMQIVSKAGSL